MTRKSIGIIMNGVTGRMGYRQHLVRSLLAIREQGGVLLGDGDRVQAEPILVGRREARARRARRAARHRPTTPPTSTRPSPTRAGRSTSTPRSPRHAPRRSGRRSRRASTIYTEKPTAETLDGGARAGRAGRGRGRHQAPASCTTSSSCRVCASSRRLIDGGFFGRILSVRGEFGYWVFEGDWQPAQRPCWNYRAEDGGGIVVDMFPHWQLRAGGPVRPGRSRSTRAPRRTSRARSTRRASAYAATADDAAYGDLRARRRRDRPAELVLDGPGQPRRAGRVPGRRHRTAAPSPACAAAGSSTATPPPSRCGTPTCPTTDDSRPAGSRCRTTTSSTTASRRSGRQFLRHVVEGAPLPLGPPRRRPRRPAGRAGPAGSARGGPPPRGAGAVAR